MNLKELIWQSQKITNIPPYGQKQNLLNALWQMDISVT